MSNNTSKTHYIKLGNEFKPVNDIIHVTADHHEGTVGVLLRSGATHEAKRRDYRDVAKRLGYTLNSVDLSNTVLA